MLGRDGMGRPPRSPTKSPLGPKEPPQVLPMLAAGLPKAHRGGRKCVTAARETLKKRGFTELEATLAGMAEDVHRENVKVVQDWGLDFWELSEERMAELCWSMLREWGLVEAFNIAPARFAALVVVLFEHSHQVPYHTKHHWFSVTATTFTILHSCPEVRRRLTKLELLAVIVGSLGHDTDHPGVTNGFLSSVSHDLAIRYNDISILENHHAATYFSLLAREDCDFLSSLTKKDCGTLRGLVVACILNTDMARHFNLLEDFKATMLSWHSTEGGRRTLLSMVVHCADIGNPLRSWPVYKKCADRIASEFSAQVRLEDHFSLPRTPHMEGLEKPAAQAKMEKGFARVFCSPTLQLLQRKFPQLEERVVVLKQNCARWG